MYGTKGSFDATVPCLATSLTMRYTRVLSVIHKVWGVALMALPRLWGIFRRACCDFL